MFGTAQRTTLTMLLARALVFVVALLPLVSGLAAPARTAPSRCAGDAARQDSSRSKAIVVSDKHTEQRPLGITYDQPAGVTFLEAPSPAGSAEVSTPVNVRSDTPYPELHVRVEWPTPSVTDLDLFIYDRWDGLMASSEGWNVDALDQAAGDNSGQGYEYIDGVPARACGRYTIRTGSWHTPGERVTLKMWLAR